MAYATLSDVLNAAPKLVITDNTKPSLTDANAITDAVNQNVESVVAGLGYAIPVTGPQSLAILKDIVVNGATARILKAMFYGVRNPNEVGANDAYREYLAKLNALADPDNPFTLPDAPQNQQDPKLIAGFDSPALSNTVDEDEHPTLTQVF